MIGRTIGNYEITERIGAGGMGEVYRARDRKLDRDVAVKALPEIFASDPERLARFEREAKVLAGLNHANIGAIYGIEEADGGRFLILELVEGQDLAGRIARGQLSIDETLEIAGQIAEALEAAHEQGVVHRDLKPANVMIRPDGQVKVLDFGLAKALESGGADSSPNLSHSPTVMGSSPTVAGVILGTAAYMSPEQARGKTVDKRSDIFAFGAVVFEMLTGRQLFTGETVSDILAAVLRAEAPLGDLPATTPPALWQLLGRCLEKDPRERLRDIGEARIAIAGIRTGDDGAAQPGAPERTKPGFLSRFGGWIAAVLVVVIAFVMMRGGGATNETRLPLRKSVFDMSPDDASVGSAFDPEISPDGRFVAYISNNELWVRDLENTDAHRIAGTNGAQEPFWSPDGEWIGFGVETQLRKIRRDGGDPVQITTMPSGITLGAAASAVWGDDGTIVIGPATSGLHTVSANGGSATMFVTPAEGETDFHEICRLPGGIGWVAVVHDHDGIGNLDFVARDKSRKALLRISESISSPTYSPTGHILFRRAGTNPGIWAFTFSLATGVRTGEPFLVGAGGRDPSVSKDGTLVYTRGARAQQVRLAEYDRAGNLVREIGEPMTTGRPFPDLSPDDKSLVMACNFGEGRELYLYDIATGNRRRLTFNEMREDAAVWYPDGKKILFYESNSYTTNTISLDGTAEPHVYENCIMCDLTPDPGEIVCSRQEPGLWNWDIYVVPADGDESDARRIVKTEATDWWPRISPNGKYLMYVTNETGRDEVFVTTFPNPAARWQISTEGGEWPRWRRDGREIVFTSKSAIMSVAVDSQDGFTFSPPKKLFDRPVVGWSSRWADGFDVSADGQTFYMNHRFESEGDVQPSIVVVQNWFAEFEQSTR